MRAHNVFLLSATTLAPLGHMATVKTAWEQGKKLATVKGVAFDPKSLQLDNLFADPGMFDSRSALSRVGFDVIKPAKETECMVAAHPSAPGYLFKKYANAVSPKEQRKNYETRIEGARKLAGFIQKRDLRHIVVPGKHLHALPRTFGKDMRVLVVERLDIFGPDESMNRYREVTEPVLRELLAVLAQFKGLDSNAKNIPFLRDGRIAFVDLEHWDRRKKSRLKSIGSYLSAEKRELAKKILDKLADD
jgi:hypothetical protein